MEEPPQHLPQKATASHHGNTPAARVLMENDFDFYNTKSKQQQVPGEKKGRKKRSGEKQSWLDDHKIIPKKKHVFVSLKKSSVWYVEIIA